ncbi:MAG: MmgE/PrpD family protein [Dethiobacteria bacterium]|nr:MmgE/PrpD family protein [Dethiobacteria bacterium]
MSYTKELSAFCADLTYDSIPRDAAGKAKLCLLDYLANIYGSLELEAVRSVVDYVRSLGGPETATALGCGFKTGLQNAAFINGTTAEAIEAQDGLRFGGNHPVSAVIPAALASAELTGAGGKKVIEAVVAGYEVANRIAASMHPHHTLSGFLPTGTCGTFGAAAAVAKIMDYSEVQTLNAIGNAGYLLPLSMAEQLMGGYTIKIVQGGQAASAGIMAAGLAGSGITSCPVVLEGSHLNGGFTQITTNSDPNLDKLTEELGTHFTISDIYFKPYTACRHTHGAVQAALELVQKEKIDPASIEAVNVFTYGVALMAVGKSVPEGGSFVSAQFSIPYLVAAAITDGELGPVQITEKRIKDQSLINLADRVSVAVDDDLNCLYPDKTASRVEIKLVGGACFKSQVEIPKGDPRDPMLDDALVEKVKLFAGNREEKKLNKAIELIMNLENLDNLDQLLPLI